MLKQESLSLRVRTWRRHQRSSANATTLYASLGIKPNEKIYELFRTFCDQLLLNWSRCLERYIPHRVRWQRRVW